MKVFKFEIVKLWPGSLIVSFVIYLLRHRVVMLGAQRLQVHFECSRRGDVCLNRKTRNFPHLHCVLSNIYIVVSGHCLVVLRQMIVCYLWL